MKERTLENLYPIKTKNGYDKITLKINRYPDGNEEAHFNLMFLHNKKKMPIKHWTPGFVSCLKDRYSKEEINAILYAEMQALAKQYSGSCLV